MSPETSGAPSPLPSYTEFQPETPDSLQKIQAYDNHLRRELYRRGEYSPEVEQDIVAGGMDQAARAGFIQDPAEYEVPFSADHSPEFYASELIRSGGDKERAAKIYKSQALRNQGAPQDLIDIADRDAALEPTEKEALVKGAVRSGRLPFAIIPKDDGQFEFAVNPDLGALDREKILELGRDIDPRFLPSLELQLTRVPGLNYTPAQARQSQEFDGFLDEQFKTDPYLGEQFSQAVEEYNRTGKTDTAPLERSLEALDGPGEFSREARRRLVSDRIKRAAKPAAYDPANPEQHVQYLESGEVWLPEQVVFNKDQYDALADKLPITPEQKDITKRMREGRLAAMAPAYVDAMGASPDALSFYEKSKRDGKSDSEIAQEWYGDPKNYSGFLNRARQSGMAFSDATKGLVESIGALAGSKGALDNLKERQGDMARNEEYARLSGDAYGIGQTIINTAPQIITDMLVAGGVSAVASPVAGAGVSGARAIARSAVSSATKDLVGGFVRTGQGSALRSIANMGDDAVGALARQVGTSSGTAVSAYVRSAGSAYVSTYSTLEQQKNPDGSQKYSDEEKRRIALGTSAISGLSTAAITLGFNKYLGGAATEELLAGKIGTATLKKLGMSDEAITSAAKTSAASILKGAYGEAAEEFTDQLVGDFIQKVGASEDFKLGPALKNALEAGLVGGVFGGGTAAFERRAEATASQRVQELVSAGAPESAAAMEKVEAALSGGPAANPTVDLQEQKLANEAKIAEAKAKLQEEKGRPEPSETKTNKLKKEIADLSAENTRLDFAIENPLPDTDESETPQESAPEGEATGLPTGEVSSQPGRPATDSGAVGPGVQDADRPGQPEGVRADVTSPAPLTNLPDISAKLSEPQPVQQGKDLDFDLTFEDIPYKGIDGKEGVSKVINLQDRLIVVANLNGVRVPFYLSSGNAGKKSVAAGKWYPFFGMTPRWINKGSSEDMNSHYGSPLLKSVADHLNATLGDVRNVAEVGNEVDPQEGPHYAAVSQGFSPVAVPFLDPNVPNYLTERLRNAGRTRPQEPSEDSVTNDSTPGAESDSPSLVHVGTEAEVMERDPGVVFAISRGEGGSRYTLWYKTRAAKEQKGRGFGSWSYIRTLPSDKGVAIEVATKVATDLATKDASVKFAFTKSKSAIPNEENISRGVAVINDELSARDLNVGAPEDLEAIGNMTLGLGKYGNVPIKDLFATDPNYTMWAYGSMNARSADKMRIYLDAQPEFLAARDAEEAQKEEAAEAAAAYEAKLANKKTPFKKPAAPSRAPLVEDNVVQNPDTERKAVRRAAEQVQTLVEKPGADATVIPQHLREKMFPMQASGAAAAIQALDTNGAFLNGDGAGVGKTRQILAVANHYASQGKPVVIITENAAIGKPWEGRKNPVLGGSMAKDGEAMGIKVELMPDTPEANPEGRIFITTYPRVKGEQVPKDAVVIFDESQSLANVYGDISKETGNWKDKFQEIFSREPKVAFFSATPADKPHQLAYLYKALGFDSPEAYLDEAIKHGMLKKTRKFGRDEIPYYDVPRSQGAKTKLYNWVNGLMMEAGAKGNFIKREISYEGTDVQFHDVKGTDPEINPWAEEFLKVENQMLDAEARGYRLLAPRSYTLYAAELSKIGEAVKFLKRELAAGRKAVLYFSRIKDMEIRGRMPSMSMAGEYDPGEVEVLGIIPSPVKLLREELKKEGITFAELHGSSGDTSKTAQDKFSKDVDVLLASVESGGTGINLDDTKGDTPRTEIFMFAPYRGISTIQAMGRIWRASTIQNDDAPNRYAMLVASDIPEDAQRSAVLAKKLQLMSASLGGTAVAKLPMSRVQYDPEQLVGLEIPEEGEGSNVELADLSNEPLPQVDIKWAQSKSGTVWWAKATPSLMKWMAVDGPERTGLAVRVKKTDDGRGYIAFADENYQPADFTPVEDAAPAEPTPEPLPTPPSGIVPNLNSFRQDLKQQGVSLTPAESAARHRALQEQVRAVYPLNPLPATQTHKSAKALGMGDIKKDNKLVQIPVNDDGITAPFTNDPFITSLQLNAGLSIPVLPAQVANLNPAIKLNPAGTNVASSVDNLGRVITGKGEYNRPATAAKEYQAQAEKEGFNSAVTSLPEADFSVLPAPVTFHGFTIDPLKTTEGDVLRHFSDFEKVDGQIRALAPELSAGQRQGVFNAAQMRFLRELREFTMKDSSGVDYRGLGFKNQRAYDDARALRKAMVWSKSGAPTGFATFIEHEVSNAVAGIARRQAQIVSPTGGPDVSPEEALERAAARNDYNASTADVVEMLDAFTPSALEGAAALTGGEPSAANLQTLVAALSSDKNLRAKYNRLAVEASGIKDVAKRAAYAARIREMDPLDLVILSSQAVLTRPELTKVLGPNLQSPALSLYTDEEIEANRQANAAEAKDLGLDEDMTPAKVADVLAHIARSSKYPRRYRAVAQSLIKLGRMPYAFLVDMPASSYAGMYSPSTHIIAINQAASAGRGVLDTFIHEMIHAATVEAVRNPQTKTARDLRDKLERYRQSMVDVVGPDQAYAVSSLDEFITHALTDPRFQRQAQETLDRGRTLWAKIIDAIASFLGIANKGFVDEVLGFVNHAAEYGYQGWRGDGAGVQQSPAVAEGAAPAVQEAPLPEPVTSFQDYLPQLPEGLTYAFSDAPSKNYATTSRANPGVVTIHTREIEDLIDGIDPANARSLVRRVVNHEIAHTAGFATLSPEDVKGIASSLTGSDILNIARKYYGPSTPASRIVEDLNNGTLTQEQVVEEWLRMLLEKTTQGGTTEDALVFHSKNPGTISRVLRYMKEAISKLWHNIRGPEDHATKVSLARMVREYRRIKNGGAYAPPVPFDTADPERDNRILAARKLEDAEPDPDEAIRQSLEPTVVDFKEPFSVGTLMKRLFGYRSGDDRLEKVANRRTQTITANSKLVFAREKALKQAMKEEDPNIDLVRDAAGSTDSSISKAQRQYINDTFDELVANAEETYRKALDSATTREDMDKAAEVQEASIKEALSAKRFLQEEAVLATRHGHKRKRDSALEQLDKTAPKTAEAIRSLRAGIDSLSKVLSEGQDPESYLKFVIDASLGTYLTRTYRMHHTDATPIEFIRDPANKPVVDAAADFLLKGHIENEADRMIEEAAEDGRILGRAEAEAAAWAVAEENHLRETVVEDYVLAHGQKAFYHGGDSFKADLTRFMRKEDVPEELRDLLGEIEDPVENLVRTNLNVGMLAASIRFTEDLAKGGLTSGSMVTEGQRNGFKSMIQGSEENYLKEALRLRLGSLLPKKGWVPTGELETEEGAATVFVPPWVHTAREARDITYLEEFEKIGADSKKYGTGKLADLYAHPQVAGWLNSMFEKDKPARTDSEKMVKQMGLIFAGATGASLATATLGSVGFYLRNLVSTVFFLGANGINPFSKDALDAAALAVKAFKNEENGWVTKLTALGVLNDDLRPQTIRELLKDEADRPGGLNLFETVGRMIGKAKGQGVGTKIGEVVGKLTDAASAIDGVSKATAFFHEMKASQRAHPDWTQAQHEQEASDKVKKTFQARSQTAPIVDDVSKSSFGKLFIPFMRFKTDMIRLVHNIPQLAAQEMKSDNPEVRARGRQRMAGFAATMAFGIAGPALMNAFGGVGDDEERALRAALPPYLRGNSLFYSKSKDGKQVTSTDLTFINPYSAPADLVSRFGRGLLKGDPDEAAKEMATWLGSQFLEDQILAGAVHEVMNNRTSDNKPITFSTDGAVDKTRKYLAHLLGSAYTPQLAKTIYRSGQAAKRGVPEDAAFFDTPVGILAAHAAPVRPRTFQTEDLALRAFRDAFATNRDVRALAGQLKRRQNLDEDDIASIVEDLYDSSQDLNSHIGVLVRGYEGLGMAKQRIAHQMKESGFSRERARTTVFAGKAAAPTLTDATRKDVSEAGRASGAKEDRGAVALRIMRSLPRMQSTD